MAFPDQFIFWFRIGLLKKIEVVFLILKIREDASSLPFDFFEPFTFQFILQTVGASM